MGLRSATRVGREGMAGDGEATHPQSAKADKRTWRQGLKSSPFKLMHLW